MSCRRSVGVIPLRVPSWCCCSSRESLLLLLRLLALVVRRWSDVSLVVDRACEGLVSPASWLVGWLMGRRGMDKDVSVWREEEQQVTDRSCSCRRRCVAIYLS